MSSEKFIENPRLLISRDELPGRKYKKEVDTLKQEFVKNTVHRIMNKNNHHSSQPGLCVLNWSCDGERLACGTDDRVAVVLVANAGRMQEDTRFSGHTGSEKLERLCWHPSDPNVFVTAAADKTVRIWDVRKRSAAHIIHTPGANINLVVSPDGKYVGVGNADDKLSIYNFSMISKESVAEKQFKGEANEFAWDTKTRILHVATGSGEIILLSWPDFKQIDAIQAHKYCITISFDPTGRYFTIGSSDTTYSNWCAHTYSPLCVVRRMGYPVRTLKYNHDGRLIAAASLENKIDISHPEKGVNIYTVPTDESVVDVAWHPGRPLLAYICEEKRRELTGSVHLFGYDLTSASSASASSVSSSVSVVTK